MGWARVGGGQARRTHARPLRIPLRRWSSSKRLNRSRLYNARPRPVFMAKTSKTNPNLQRVVQGLRDVSREAGSAIWRDVADRLGRSRKNWAEGNLSRLGRYAAKGEQVGVPGVILGTGGIATPVTVPACRARGSTASRMRGIGPNYPRRPDMILRRTISRMMPYQQPRGREALKRLRVYLSLPDAYKDKPLEIVEVAKRPPQGPYISLGEISRLLGSKFEGSA